MENTSSFWIAAAAAAAAVEDQDISQEERQANVKSVFPSSPLTKRFSSNNDVDIIISAGGKVFPARKATLSHQSQYFKSALDESVVTGRPPIHNINLPTIPHEYFSILLAGMNTNGNYTPLLTTENVYQVLLYSQLLQIPNSISQCREFIADLYLSDRRLRNPLIPNMSIDKHRVKSNENNARDVFDVHTAPSCSQAMSSGKIIKPIPNRISRGTSQIYEETGGLNSMSHGDLNDLWKPWIQHYHQRLCFPSTIRAPPVLEASGRFVRGP